MTLRYGSPLRPGARGDPPWASWSFLSRSGARSPALSWIVKNRAGEGLSTVNQTVTGFVKENPYKSIAIAAGAGLLIGLILKRR